MDRKKNGIRILYVGNQLTEHGLNPTTIDLLSVKLKEEFDVICVSNKRNVVARILHMLVTIVKLNQNVNLVLIDTYSTLAFYYALFSAILCRILKIPYVPILHGGNLPKRLKENPVLSKIIFGKATKIVSPSHYLIKEFTERGYDVTYIPNFITIDNYVFRKRIKVFPNLLFVRSLHKIYNPLLAVKTLKLVQTFYPDASLCMVGPDKDGSIRDIKMYLSKNKLEKSCKILGGLSKNDWLALSKDYDVFINPTNFDNMPVSVVEAMALGLPVVSTNVGGLPYLIEDGIDGLLIPPDNPEEFVEKIKLLLNNPDLAASLSEAGRQKALQFDWSRVKTKWNELINEAIQ